MSSLRRRVEKAERRAPDPPPPPPPRPDPEQRALLSLLNRRLRGEPWSVFKAALTHVQGGGDPDDLSDEQRRLLDVVATLLAIADDQGVTFVGLGEDRFEQYFVAGLLEATRCALLQALWQRCWAIEAGTEEWLPPDADLIQVFNSKTGEPWFPIGEHERVREGRRLARELAQVREVSLLEGAAPITDGETAAALVERLFDPATGRLAQRRRKLERLGEEVGHVDDTQPQATEM